MIKLSLSILFCLLITLLSGCFSYLVCKKNEPATILIRNTSHENMKEVSIREVQKGNHSIRMGVISPLPRGASQVVGRPTNPPPLPKKIILCWINSADIEFCKQVDLRNVLKDSPVLEKALVFEIGHESEFRVYLEKNP